MKFENTKVFNFEGALRGMRNPLESWDKSDSYYGCDCGSKHDVINTRCDECLYGIECNSLNQNYIIGQNDLNLAKKLINAGTDHSKFMRQIMVSVDITAPLYWWKEYDTYKVGTVANSTSTMHKIATTPITEDCFEIGDYNSNLEMLMYSGWSVGNMVNELIEQLEHLRKRYLETNDKRYWKELVRWLPESWLQTRTCTMSYQNLRQMYHARKNHKLDEWSKDFCTWIESLPYAVDLITT